MIEHKVADIPFYSYRLFENVPNLTAVVTTRRGGRSEGPFSSFNLGLHVGDDPDAVLENRALLAQAVSIEPEWLTLPEQVHGADVAEVTRKDRGRGAVTEDDAVPGVDALITRSPDTPLMVLLADCVAVCLYDPGHAAIGLVHAGWRGTLARVAERTMAQMASAFGTRPEDLLAVIGPSIGRGHYEVGQEVLDAYVQAFGRKEAAAYVAEDMDGTCYLDLWSANEWQLRRAGMTPDRIAITEMCTACHTDRFYSHRHESGRTGRFGVLMMIHGAGGRSYA